MVDPLLRGPSAEARAFLANPANRKPDWLDLAALPARRAEERALAEKNAPEICDKHGVSVQWRTIAGHRCLEVTPSGKTVTGTLLYIFGGGFISGGPLEDLQISAPLAASTGLTVLAPEYRLAPEHPFPAALDDIKTVTSAIAGSGRYVLAGESAGGNLALVITQWIEAQSLSPPRALALLSPAADMSEQFRPDEAPDDPTLRPGYIAGVNQAYAPSAKLDDPMLSPLFGHFTSDWPPTIITTGTRDLFLGPCTRLEQAIRTPGGDVALRVWDGLWHVFEYYPEVPEAAQSLDEIASFLKEKL